jgi:citrate synthase
LQIQVLSVNITTVPTARGSYQVADVAFKNLTFGGKVEGKKVTSFGNNAAAFAQLSTAQPNDTFDVVVQKNDKGFNEWTSMSKAVVSQAQQAPAAQTATETKATTYGKSTYETPEERAKKQVYIIRQSSLTNAVATLSVGSKAVSPDSVLALAEKYVSYVLGESTQVSVEELPPEID